jgi:hypothetical protein
MCAEHKEQGRNVERTVLPPEYRRPIINEHDQDKKFWDGVDRKMNGEQ